MSNVPDPTTPGLTPRQKAAITRQDNRILAARKKMEDREALEPSDRALLALATSVELAEQHDGSDSLLRDADERSMTPEGWSEDMLQSKSEALATIVIMESMSIDLQVPVAGPAAEDGSEDDPFARILPGTIAWSFKDKPGMFNHPKRIVPKAASDLAGWVTAHSEIPGPINKATGKPRWTNKEFHNLAVYYSTTERNADAEFAARVGLAEDEYGLPGVILWATYLRPNSGMRAKGKVAMLVAMFPKTVPAVDWKTGEIKSHYSEIGYNNPDVQGQAWQSAGIVRYLDQDQLDGVVVQIKAHNDAKQMLKKLERQAAENLEAAEEEARLAAMVDSGEEPVRSSKAAVEQTYDYDAPF